MNNTRNNTSPYLRFVDFSNTLSGNNGDVMIDNNYFYIFSQGKWRTAAISACKNMTNINNVMSESTALTNGTSFYDKSYFYIYYNGWKSIAFSPIITPQFDNKPIFSIKRQLIESRIMPSPITSNSAGQEGYIGYDSCYFYVYCGKLWRKFAISN